MVLQLLDMAQSCWGDWMEVLNPTGLYSHVWFLLWKTSSLSMGYLRVLPVPLAALWSIIALRYLLQWYCM